MAINVIPILPPNSYSPSDENLIQSTQIEATFNPSTDYIEYVISTTNNSFQTVDYGYSNYHFPTDGTVVTNSINLIEINPVTDINSKNISSGDYNVYYNFYKSELSSSYDNQSYFIKSISSDRTEVIIRYLNPNIGLVTTVDEFKLSLSTNISYFEDFYLNFGDNILTVANNIAIDPTTFDIIINLYQPLPSNVDINSPLWVVTKIADSLAFNILFTPEPISPPIVTFGIKGPNFNLNIQDRVNNSTNYTNYTSLLSNTLTSSINQIKSFLDEKGLDISIDYTDFSNFIHFSSAEQRINNFYYKVKQIETYNNELISLSTVTSSQNSSVIIQQKITDIITNFDGYEYYLYYDSSSYTWPKSTSTVPYVLYPTGSAQALAWYSSTTGSASLYDSNNQDYLYYVIPEYIRDDSQNDPYISFIQLVGQHYDYIWTYYKDVTNRYNADNRLDFGISKDLVAEALRSFGVKIYQNNFTSKDLFNAFTGFNSGSTGINLSPTGSDLITSYITASYEASVTPIDDYNKEIYKRIYHNLPYLSKTKGTIPGLRALINCFGVPDTVLRISEFGGRDKDTSTYDYFDQQFNYAFNSYYKEAAPNAGVNWLENTFILHPNWNANNNRPESIQLRFKTAGLTNTYQSQSIFTITSGSGNGIYSKLTLLYTGSGYTSASYSGSTPSASYQFAKLNFYPNTLFPNATASVYLPFFDEGWWSVMVNRSGNTYTLYAGNSLYYDGYDGNQIGYLASSSITTSSLAWPSGSQFVMTQDAPEALYPGVGSQYTPFTGSFQELRFWARTGSVESFKDFIMNPQSIDYNGETDYANYLAHRLPLGTDLILTTSSTPFSSLTSVHPKVTGSWAITQSFSSSVYGVNNTVISAGKNPWYTTNVGPRFLNSPVVGLRGRVTDKIQIVSSSLPTGSVISQYISIEQSYPSLGSESPDVNILEVAFSPQNEINDDIINSLGYFNIGEYIGDPRQVTSSATSYPDLNTLSNNFFQKYFDTYDLTDYVRLIKYFDNSLFKMIKDFVPARTSLTTGIVIKQHILERNKYPQPQVYNTQFQNINVYSSSAGLYEVSNYGEDLTYEGTIDTAFISGSTGGTFDQYNVLTTTQTLSFIVSGSFIVDPEQYINYFNISSSAITNNTNNQVDWNNGEITTNFNGLIQLITSGSNSPGGNTIDLRFSSSLQGTISTTSTGATTFNITSSLISCSYGEKFSLWIQDGGSGPNTVDTQFGLYNVFPYSQQTWPQYYTGSAGVSTIIHSTQDEFYNGELPGTEYVVTNGELNPNNDFKYPTTLEIYYNPTLYLSSITPLSDFLDINTSPNQGEIYLWFDTGSVLQPSQPGTPQR
jgi:hypothetical protein